MVSTLIAAAAASLIEAGIFTSITAATFAVSFALSQIVTRIFADNPESQQDMGVRQQVPPSAVNAMPIVYGDAYMGGTFVDAVLTTDQKTMYYVLAISSISEANATLGTAAGVFNYDCSEMYYGDRLISFESSGSVQSARVFNGGSGYAVGNVLTILGGTFSTATVLTVASVNTGGIVATVNVTTVGSYTIAPNNAALVTGGAGTGASFVLKFSTYTNTVTALSDESGNIDTKINTNLYINLYKSTAAGVITSVNGASAPSTVMGGSDIAVGQRWPAANRQMNNLGFAIVKLVYNRDADTTQLQPITFNVSHYPNGAGVAKPGDVWLDYMSNASYGGAIPPTSLDTTCVATLNAYSDATITYTPSGGGSPVTQARYRINGVLDAGQTVLSNVDRIMSACDSWMTYSAALGQWSVVINKAESAAYAFTDNNIIGDIRVGATDITSSINQIEARFPFKSNRDQASFVNIQTPNGLLYPNEPVNKYSVTYDLVNDSVQAQYLANRTLEQAREDLLVSFNTTYYGIQVDAGNVISVTNADYGWNAKLFRVMKVNEASLPDGSLGARLELTEYNAQVYDDYDITQFTPAPNSDLSSPVYFSALVAPTVTGFPTATVPNFSVTVTIPATGRVTFGNLFYTTVASPAPTDWKLLANAATADSQPVINGTTYTYANLSLSAGTYYFAYLVGNDISQSALSPISTAFVWAPTGATGPAGDNGLTAVTGYKVQGQATAAPTFTTPTTGTALPSGWYASLDLALAALVPPQAAVAVGQVVWYIQGQYNSNATTLGGVPANKTAWTGPIAASVFQDIRSDNWNGSNPPVAATSTTWGTTGYYIKQSTGDMFLNSVYGRGQAILNGSNTVGTATFALVANSALGSNGGVIAYSGTILNGAIMGYATGAAFGGYFDTSGTQAALACNSTGTGAALQVNGKMTTTNSTLVSNLNAQYLNGNLASDFATAASGTAAYAANRLNGSGGTNVLRFAEGTVTGTAIATFTATNKPASNSANEWVKITIDGVALYIPAWT